MKTFLAILFAVFGLFSGVNAQSVEQAADSGPDLWGEAALRQPGGPTYAFFEKLLPPLRYVDAEFHHYPITLSAPGNPTKARFVSNGSAINALARQPNWVSEAGRPITFYVGDGREVFGSDLSHLSGPVYADGYLPIVQLSYEAGAATYAQEAFASVDPQLADLGVVLVKWTLVTASGRNYQAKPARDQDPASTQPVAGVEAAENLAVSTKAFDEKIEARIEGPEMFVLRGDRIVLRVSKDEADTSPGGDILAMAFPRPIFNPGRGALIAPLMEGESQYFAFFTKPAKTTLPFKLTAETYAEQRALCTKTWNSILDRGMVVQTPEKVVNDAARAEIIGNFMLISGDQMRYSAGNAYNKRYIGEGTDAIVAQTLWGQGESASKLMPAQFAYTRAGLEFHQAAHKLQMLSKWYALTKDEAYVRSIRPMWQKEIDVIVKGRQTDNGMFPREKYCGDIDTRVFSLNSNANAWRALRDWSEILGELGEKEQSATLAKVQAEYRKTILDAIAKAARRDVDPPFLPIALSGEENPHDPIWGTTMGSYWNLMIEYVLGSGVFTADSQSTTDVLHYLQQKGGLTMGMLRARATPGNFWVAGPRINDLYGMRYALTLLQRDEPDRALVSFYGKLAQGMTRGTFIGCEGSSMMPLDQHGRQMYLPPNSAANANYLQQLRYFLVQDYDLDDDGKAETLRLGYATPRAWLADGQKISVKNAPTAFGVVSFELQREGETVHAVIDLPTQTPSATRLRLRAPEGDREVDLTGKTGHVTLDIKVTQ